MSAWGRGIAGCAWVIVSLVCLSPRGAHAADEQGPRPEAPASAPKVKPPADRLAEFRDALPFELSGFWEIRGGLRTQNDPHQDRDASIGESRLQLQMTFPFDWGEGVLKTDFYYDAVLRRFRTEFREMNLAFSPLEFMDVKFGRQIITWGTGDLIFINDLFPKDWKSFFIGRDVEYLKAPSDALKVSFFSDAANLDVVWTPVFDPDEYIEGERLSYYNPLLGGRAGEDARVRVHRPNQWFDRAEVAWRLWRMAGSTHLALYGYHGFWKSPAGFDLASMRNTSPRLTVYGASARGNVLRGIGNIEVGYYDSSQDRQGDDPFIPNSQVRFLLGYEREAARDLTVAVQYYMEYMLNHKAYSHTLPAGMPQQDEWRHVLTIRLTRLAFSQKLKLSLFTYYSPSDHDVYIRPHVNYKMTDNWAVEFGANIFFGDDEHTFFNQFADNTNIYCGTRYTF